MPEPVLSMSGVAVLREGATLLEGIDWTVREGERWAVLGPNGAGKTTLLQVAGASLAPSRGQVDLLGERVGQADLGELRTRIGLSSAALADRVPPHERVLDVVVTASYGVIGRWGQAHDSGDVDRAGALLARVGLRHPELLLLDEPAAGLDLGAREALLHLLSRLWADADGPPVVLVTHHVEEVPLGTTHALLLVRGRALAAGPVGDVLTAPLLSRAFGLPLLVDAAGGRFSARAA